MKIKCRYQFPGIALAVFLFCHTSVRANVYATDIRVNGSQNAGVIIPGAQAAISYILNDEASAGVTVRIWSGTNPVHTFTAPGGSPGTQLGLNIVAWGGTNDVSGVAVQPGVYTVSITAASAGYDTWTNITDDGTNFYAPEPRGIDVNRNTNSPYYGRVFVGCTFGLYAIVKCNADGSPADEGGISSGGLTWGAGDPSAADYSPWKIAVGANDKVYINDFSGFGVVYAFDETISTNYLVALGATNYPYWDPNLSGLCVTRSATNDQIWMTDDNPLGVDGNTNPPAGILRWQLGADGTAATNDTGTIIAPVTNTSPLSWAPYDVAIDTSGYIYTIQQVTTNLGIAPIMCFPPYNGRPETNVVWTIGAGDTTLIYAYGIAVNQTATFVAVAVRGDGDAETGLTGKLNLYYATNGQFLTNLDKTGGDQYTDVGWDNVGNLYALDTFANGGVWRVYSPPGSNQATTVAVPFIQAYDALTPPSLLNPNLSTLGLNFMLQGQSNVTYFIEQSPDLVNWTPVTTNFSPSTSRPISISCPDNQDFYRAVVGQ